MNGTTGTGGSGGNGGTGIIATGSSTITNAGTIQGGLDASGTTRADAIDLSGGGNTLIINAGSRILGNVVSNSGTTNGGDAFALGGTGNGTFNVDDLGAVGSSAQYQGFSDLQKRASSTWTLTGSDALNLPWLVSGGTLSISNGISLGNATTTFDGGGLLTTADVTISGAIAVDGNGGTINNGGNYDTFNGNITNAGALTFSGAGTATLVSGLTNSGTLHNQSSTTLNDAGSVTNAGTITNAGSVTVAAAGTVTGTGAFTQSAGTTTVNGSFAQSSMAINGGRLQGTGTLNVTNPVTIGSGAIIDPGMAPGTVGILTSDGSIDITGTLNIDLASLSGFDQLNVTGATSNVTFGAGSKINFMLDGSFMPSAGNTFDFLSALGGVKGFSNLTYGFTGMGLSSNLSAQLLEINGNTGLQLDITNAPATVPLPGSGWLFLSGVVGLMGIARRRVKVAP